MVLSQGFLCANSNKASNEHVKDKLLRYHTCDVKRLPCHSNHFSCASQVTFTFQVTFNLFVYTRCLFCQDYFEKSDTNFASAYIVSRERAQSYNTESTIAQKGLRGRERRDSVKTAWTDCM